MHISATLVHSRIFENQWLMWVNANNTVEHTDRQILCDRSQPFYHRMHSLFD